MRPSKQKAKNELHEFTLPQSDVWSVYTDFDIQKLKERLQISKKNQNILEIGMGTGEFLCAYAQQNPNTLCVGVEIKEERIVTAIKLAQSMNLKNIIFVCAHTETILPEFSEQFFDTVYVNFPDPWPKKKHAKRRFTSNSTLNHLSKLLRTSGSLELKTDNTDLYTYSLVSLRANNWLPISISPLPQDEKNLETRYESKYRKQGKTIHKIIAKLDEKC